MNFLRASINLWSFRNQTISSFDDFESSYILYKVHSNYPCRSWNIDTNKNTPFHVAYLLCLSIGGHICHIGNLHFPNWAFQFQPKHVVAYAFNQNYHIIVYMDNLNITKFINGIKNLIFLLHL